MSLNLTKLQLPSGETVHMSSTKVGRGLDGEVYLGSMNNRLVVVKQYVRKEVRHFGCRYPSLTFLSELISGTLMSSTFI